ncbi:MAG: MlaD family protein [Gordonia sp. (in: high G+C Gram-positive bacteria)]
MKITRFVRVQLIIFTLVTIVAVAAMAVYYVRLPAMAGIGRYGVELRLPTTGGLYRNAGVSYRGVNVGKVTSVRLTPDGVAASLSIRRDAKIPADAQAAVRSESAVGEQFVEFTPGPQSRGGGYLHDGSVVTSGNIPVEISSVLDQANALLTSVGDTRLRTAIDAAFTAFNGTGEDLRRLLDSMTLFVDAADKNSAATIDLIRQAGPLLATQNTTAGAIAEWTANVTKVTDQLRANRPEIVDILAKGPSTAARSQQLFAAMDQTYPMLINNLAVESKTLAVYLPNLGQVLVIYPRLINALLTAVNAGSAQYGPNVLFSLGVQDPPPCTVGYLPAAQWRSPAVQTAQELPPGLLCRLPQDSSIAVRGARNFPCVEFPGRRAPTPAECRTGYTPTSNRNVALPNGIGGLAPKLIGYTTAATPSAYEPGPAVYGTTYDPETGDFIGPDGKTYNAGTGRDQQGRDSTWQSLITEGIGR